MKSIHIDEKLINGISIRTTNAIEMDPQTSQIGSLYQRFDEEVAVDYKNGSRVYGVYYNYESDASGEFSVLAGTDQIEQAESNKLEKLILPKGKYIVFEAKGDIPQVVIDTWGEIWKYFDSQAGDFERAYGVDFEYYKNQNEVEIYIGVK